jgi:hypothetical protein
MYPGSADLLPHNPGRRAEILFPPLNSRIVRPLCDGVLEKCLADNRKSHAGGPDGVYEFVPVNGTGAVGFAARFEPRSFPVLGSVRFAFLYFSRVDPADGLGFQEVYERAGDGRCRVGAREPGTAGVSNPRNPGNASVFFWPKLPGFVLQKILFLRIPEPAGLFGGSGAGGSGRDLAHVLISAALWHTPRAIFAVDSSK